MAATQILSYPRFHWEEIHLQDSTGKTLSRFPLSVSVGDTGVLYILPYIITTLM